MKIFDCFTYYNEEELLKIRLHELDKYIDYFVIVEASETFTGNKKSFHLQDCMHWLHPFLHKIIRVKILFGNDISDPWEREYFQRNQICQGLYLAEDNDIILISDVDEIINTKVIKTIKKIESPVQLDNKQYFWNFHWQVPDHCNQGARPVACRKKHLNEYTPQQMRAAQMPKIPNAGWHFSYLFQTEQIINKIESFAHTEYNQEEYKDTEKILYRIENGIDPFDRFPLKYYEIDKTYPSYVRKNYN